MITKTLPALRTWLTERLPEFAKPGLVQFEAMVRADAANQLQAELDSINERYATFMAAAIDFWLAAYVVSPAGEAASEALVDLFDARAVVHTADLDGDGE